MAFFAARKPAKAVVKSSTARSSSTNGSPSSTTAGTSKPASTSATAVNKSTSTTTTASPATKLVSVTRRVNAAIVPQTLKERQALARAKRAKELDRAAHIEEERRRRVDSDEQRSASAKRSKLEKGKARADGDANVQVNGHSLSKRGRADSSSSSNSATPARRSKLTVQSSDDEGNSRLGTPVFERKQPLRVPRGNVAAPRDSLDRVNIISGEQHVRSAMSDYAPYFPDIPPETVARLEYPGDSAYEDFLLVKPRVKDGQDYHAVQDIITTIRIMLDHFLTSEQAMECFKHVQNQSASGLSSRGDFDFLAIPSPSASRSCTPALESGAATPEPAASPSNASASAVSSAASAHVPNSFFSKQPFLRHIEKAHRRNLGKDFLSALEYFNTTIRDLKTAGAIRENIEKMGREQGIPEAVWMQITGQCYERTVGPRMDELKKYEAFSDSVYGELLPPFVAHIASLTGLNENSVLVDMGSGVGNCVAQASLATGCKSYGFENQASAASIAEAQTKELLARSRLWGLRSGACETHECDFLASPSLVGPALREADVVIINNYVFSPTTNEALSLMFLDLKEGAKIVSLKPFVHQSGNVGEITERNAYSPASILNQSKPIVYTRGSVSWSDEPGKFYIATVNRDRLRRFLAKNGESLE